ncbi:MAG: PhoPQ-activated protein PqaA family protein [Pirellulales bacterium]
MRWDSQSGPVHSLFYENEPFDGHETEVFAYYASPSTLAGQADPASAVKSDKQREKFPGVVLIHGGGGTAFSEWAWLWAKRGYAAIAMDLGGCKPFDPKYDDKGVPVLNQTAKPDTRTRLPNGGPDQGHPAKFDTIGGAVSDDWPYHAVAAAIRAHSLLRSMDEVDADHTAVTGISWGGYTTCLVASLDNRFQAAVPVYGCGFLFEGESVQKPSIDKLSDRRDQWIQTYDPSSYLGRCRVPMLMVNGTNDVHYPLDSYFKSYERIAGPKQLRIQVRMPHSHPAGWAPQEIGLFIDSYCHSGKPLPRTGSLQKNGDKVEMSVESSTTIPTAELHYTTDTGLRSDRTWKSIPATFMPGKVVADLPPSEATTWYLSVTDERGAMVSGPIQFGSLP